MKSAQLKTKSAKELATHAVKLRTTLVEKRKAMITGEQTNSREYKNLRKELARTLTYLSQKPKEETNNG